MSGRWTDTETSDLRRMRAAGVRDKEIARFLPGRSVRAVSARINYLGLPPACRDLAERACFNISYDTLRAVEAISRKTGMHRAAVFREAIERGLAEMAIVAGSGSAPRTTARENSIEEARL